MNYKSFEEYLRKELSEGKIDFQIRITHMDGVLRFYIHPEGRNGDTIDLIVNDNQLYMVQQLTDNL